MALHWNLTEIENSEEKCWYKTGKKNEDGSDEERMHPVTEMLIWSAMFVGFHVITEANHEEYFVRLKMQEDVSGPFLQQTNEETGEREPRLFTLQDVKDHIGLRTNGMSYTKVQFRNNLVRSIREKAERELIRQKRGE